MSDFLLLSDIYHDSKVLYFFMGYLALRMTPKRFSLIVIVDLEECWGLGDHVGLAMDNTKAVRVYVWGCLILYYDSFSQILGNNCIMLLCLGVAWAITQSFYFGRREEADSKCWNQNRYASVGFREPCGHVKQDLYTPE